MVLIDPVRILIILGFYISIAGFVFGSVMGNRKVRDLLVDFWADLATQLESPMLLKAHSLEIAANIFSALYHRNGKLSHVKLFTITYIFTVSGIMAVVLDENKTPGGAYAVMLSTTGIGIFIFAFIWTIGCYLYEYLAYRISLYFLSRATQKNNKIYLGVNLVVLILVVYGFPALLFFSIVTLAGIGEPHHTLTIFDYILMPFILVAAASPMIPIFYIYNRSDHLFSQILMFPAALSVCFPIALLVGSLAMLHNRWILSSLIKSIERISEVNARRIKLGSLALLYFVSSISGIVGYLTPK